MQILSKPLILTLVAFVLFAVLVALLRLFGRMPRTQSVAFAYEAVALLTPAERSFYGVLQQVLASDYQILAKVRLADIIQPVQDSNRSSWQSALNRINQKHVDFVLCDSAHLNIVAVIELDDRTHERIEREVRDSFVDTALKGAGIPVLRVSARQSYSPTQIREQVDSLLRLSDRGANKTT